MENSLSDRIAAHVAGFRAEDMRASTLAAAKWILLDAVGVIMGASGAAREADPFVSVAVAAGGGPCAILGTGERVSAPMAALANGALAHALDYEDTFDPGPGHPNASLVPALIALSQSQGPVDGKTLLASLTVGGDLACRMAMALRVNMEDGGWFPPPIMAAYGAAAGASRLLQLDAERVKCALSLMLCQAVMPGEIRFSKATTLRAVREGFPAISAVNAALLARAGVIGLEQPLEGPAGFYQMFAGGAYDQATLLEGLGERFLIEELTFKPWPSCRGTHAGIELALELRNTPGMSLDAIEEIVVGHDQVQKMLGEPLERKQAPATVIDAKFSIPFTVALALVRGKVGIADFTEETLADPQILNLAAKVRPYLNNDAGWQRGTGGSMEIRLRDGTSIAAEVGRARGSPERPLNDTERTEKFVECAAAARSPLSRAEALALAEKILAIETCDNVGALFA